MSRHAFNCYARRFEVPLVSAVFLNHVALCALESVKDAGVREDFVGRCSILLSAEDAASLRQVAGLPPEAPDARQVALEL